MTGVEEGWSGLEGRCTRRFPTTNLGPQGALGLGKALEHEVVYAAVGDVAVRGCEVESYDYGHALLSRQLPCIEQGPIVLRALFGRWWWWRRWWGGGGGGRWWW